MFDNERFMELGFAFHRNGDELGKVLKTKSMKASLRALDKTMAYCTECHATFRQRASFPRVPFVEHFYGKPAD